MIAGSTNTLRYTPSLGEADSITVAVADADGQPVTLSHTPTWDTDAYLLTLEADEVPVSAIGETWQVVWTLTYGSDTYRDVERATITEGMPDVAVTVGVDSYVTFDEAEAFAAGIYGANAWAGLSDADKARCLITAARSIDALMLKGRKLSSDQRMEFPRVIIEHAPAWSELYEGADTDEVVPQSVKDAQVLEAVSIASSGGGDSQRARLQREGVTSISIGSLSESYGGVAATGRLRSDEAHKLMGRWILSGVRMRGWR